MVIYTAPGTRPEIAEATGLTLIEAQSYHAQAERRANEAAMAVIAMSSLDRNVDGLKHRVPYVTPTYLKRFTGYSELFGGAGACQCEPCQSMLSPAAYFVDLMYFVEHHVSDFSFGPALDSLNPLHLRSRRPDLWSLELTCDNTNNVVPALDLVIGMLETFIVKQKHLTSVAELYERLATVDHSIRLPFSLPVERLSMLLGHLGISRNDIARTFLLGDQDAETRAAIQLGILPKQWLLITTSRLGDLNEPAIRAAERFYSQWLGATLTPSPATETEHQPLDAGGAALNVTLLTRASGLDRAAVRDSLATDFVNGADTPADARAALETGIATAGGVQNDTDLVRNLTLGRLERFERLVRLWRHVPWTVRELDYVIGRLRARGLADPAPGPDGGLGILGPTPTPTPVGLSEIVVALAELLDFQDSLGVRVDELCALWDGVPTTPLRDNDRSLFDRAFNQPRFDTREQTAWPAADLAELIDARPHIRARLVAALHVTDDDLSLLTDRLAPNFGTVSAGPGGREVFTHGAWLNEPNLSLLYRHARLARLLKLSVAELLQTISLAASTHPGPVLSLFSPGVGQPCISSLADLRRVLRVHHWRVASGFSVLEAVYLTTPGSHLAAQEAPDDLAARMADEVAAERSLLFTVDVFTQIGLTRAESATLVAANSASGAGVRPLFVPGVESQSYRIASNISPADVEALIYDVAPSAAHIAQIARDLIAVITRAGAAGFEPLALTALGMSLAEAGALVAANTSSGAVQDDGRPFERLPGSATRYRLRAVVAPADAVARFGMTQQDRDAATSAMARRAVGLVMRSHVERVLAAKASTVVTASPDKAAALLRLALPDAPPQRIELVDALLGGPRNALSVLLDRVQRYAVLFRSSTFDALTLDHLRTNPADPTGPTGLALTQPLSAETVRRVAQYAILAATGDRAYEPDAEDSNGDALRIVLMWSQSVAAASTEAEWQQLATALRTDVRRVQGVVAQVPLPAGRVTSRVDELVHLDAALQLTARLGVAPAVLRQAVSEAPVQLAQGADGVSAAVGARYPDAKTFHAKLEPFEDSLRSRTRDGLVDYVLSAPDDASTDWRKRFTSVNDLYHHFLTDVMVEGCARTSALVAATSTVQLYVQRVVMNLERSDAEPYVVASFDDARNCLREWREWRKNFQVWVANRKVFLHPENYIEPGLRADKTPLFAELEDALLQQEINASTVQDAYARYLIGFDEVARLTVAGAYYDGAVDVLHLFGATQDDPPVHYYRTITRSKSAAPTCSAWQKLSLQIPVRNVSPILFRERLHIFWVETTTRPVISFLDGASNFDKYRHSLRVKYSTLRADGAWMPPQRLNFSNRGATEESRTVDDLKLGKAEREALEHEIAALNAQLTNLAPILEHARTEASLAHTEADAARKEPPSRSFLDPAAALEAAEVGGIMWANSIVGSLALLAGPGASASASEIAFWEQIAFHLFANSHTAASSTTEVKLAGVSATDSLYIMHWKVLKWRAEFRERITHDVFADVSAAATLITESIKNLEAKKSNTEPVQWDRYGRDHFDPLENYKPDGWDWDRVYPDVIAQADDPTISVVSLMLVPRSTPGPLPPPRNLSAEVDFAAGLLRPAKDTAELHIVAGLSTIPGQISPTWVDTQPYGGQYFYIGSLCLNLRKPVLGEDVVATTRPDSTMQVVNGAPGSIITESGSDVVWLRRVNSGNSSAYECLRLGTSVTPELTNRLSRLGADGLLDSDFQNHLQEIPSRTRLVGVAEALTTRNPFDPANPYLTYSQETFFHIPFLVANHLNSQQRFAETQTWYHHIFDPTAADGAAWRYGEFRAPIGTGNGLRDILTNPAALAAYRADPFNPHAIAALRPGTYQKSIVMKYVDNLLDWGDSLYSQFTMESVNEATMLYVMAVDILGPRPAELGPCGDGTGLPRTYAHIAPLLRPAIPGQESTADFLIEEFELVTLVSLDAAAPQPLSVLYVTPFPQLGTSPAQVATAPSVRSPLGAPAAIGSPAGSSPPSSLTPIAPATWAEPRGTALIDLYSGSPIGGRTSVAVGGEAAPATRFFDPDPHAVLPGGTGRGVDSFAGDVRYDKSDIPLGRDPRREPLPTDKQPVGAAAAELVRSRAIFCIPDNMELRAYWDRVEGRLNQVRNCIDISGVRRQRELFAPEIDPRLLVRMRAAGLSFDDVLNVTSGNVPPYRFTYLIEKAKQHAGVVQNFGSQLLGALEKKDGEELTRLRTVHEQNLLRLRSQLTQWEINAAEDAIEVLRRQRSAAEYRRDHFFELGDVGLLASESKQQQLQGAAAGYRTQAGVAQMVASLLTIIPDVGAPTSMKFGGSQLGAAGRAVAEALNAKAAFNEMGASMAGMESGNKRRDQEWRHQFEVAKREISQIDTQITAAGIRRDIAVESQQLHERTISQVQEVFDFLRNRFTDFGRFTWLSTELHKLHRNAFNDALSMARLAEHACQFERPDESDGPALAGGYWDAGNAGLLAGDRLLLDLQNLERRYIETNHRTLEIEQSFSLARSDPGALSTLKGADCACEFEIPEWFFDLTYPGHYRRRVKAVRLSIPAVVGPHTNVGATLRLVGSHIRKDARTDSQVAVPLRHMNAIAASMGQSDAGVFEFSFRDERYMPFEGAGVNSRWQLSLPKAIKPFDYATISDVILRISYTAEEEPDLKKAVEKNTIGVLAQLTDPGITRVFSMRSDFRDAWHALLEGERKVTIDIRDIHLPFFISQYDLAPVTFDILVNKLASTDTYPVLTFDGSGSPMAGPPAADPPVPPSLPPGDDAGMYWLTSTTVAFDVVGKHDLEIISLGTAGIGAAPTRIDESKIEDIVLRVVLSKVATQHA